MIISFLVRAGFPLAFATILLGLFSSSAAANNPQPLDPVAVNRSHANYPMSFEANQGQADPKVKFLSRGLGYTLFLTPTEAVFTLRHAESTGSHKGKQLKEKGIESVLRMALIGANPNPNVHGVGAMESSVNYFLGSDPKEWISNIGESARIQYDEVYPGINLIYYGNQQQLEYDFVVNPGAVPKNIGLRFTGADEINVTSDGELELRLGKREVRWHKPVAYQEIDGARKSVTCDYTIKNSGVGFQLGEYDTSKPLIIDPTLVYSTYLGGSLLDGVESIAVDTGGNVYVTGETESLNFPTVAGSYRITNSGLNDIFVTKINPAGTARVFSTYVGSKGDDFGKGIALDGANNVYVTGFSTSNNFPVVNQYATFGGGDSDAFIFKLNSTGTSLLYSSYFGAGTYDAANAIAVDASGNAYIAGETDAENFFPAKNNFPGGTSGNGNYLDAFIAKFNPASSGASSLVYASALGNSPDERATAIALDSSANAYLTGEIQTYSDPGIALNFPLVSPFQSTFGGGSSDAFVAKVSAAGTTLMFSTYLGGTENDTGYGITVDSTGVYIVGCTYSANFYNTNAQQTVKGGGVDSYNCDVFVTKLSTNGSTLLYSTFLGGEGDDTPFGVAVDSSGYVYVTGQTGSDDFPNAGTTLTNIVGGISDGFVAKLNPAVPGSAGIIFSTLFGGSGEDVSTCIALDTNRSIYIGGLTASTNFPIIGGIPPNSYASGASNVYDGFIAKFAAPADLSLTQTAAPQPVQLGSNITFTIKLNNNSQFTFSGVVVTNQLPPGVSFVSASSTLGSISNNSSGLVTWTLGAVTNNSTGTITITATATNVTTITNSATVTAIETEPNLANNTAITTTDVRGTSDVTLTMASAPNPVLAGNNVTNTVVVQNKGPQTAHSVVIIHTLPSGTALVASNTTQGIFLVGSLSVTCNVGTMLNNTAVTNSLVLSFASPGIKTNTSTVSAFEIDNLPGNNSASTNTTVYVQADVAISTSSTPPPLFPGSSLTYTLTVTNLGPSDASNVVVSNTLPANVSYVSAISTRGTPAQSGQLVTCNIGTLTNGTSATITINVTAGSVGSGTNITTASTTTPDPNLANNTASVVTTISLPTSLITSIQPVGANVIISFTTVLGKFYRVDRVDNLGDTAWITVSNNVAGTGAIVQVTDVGGAGRPSRFYRIVEIPNSTVPPQLNGIQINGNDVLINFNTVAGLYYRVERADSLAAPAWITVADAILGTGIVAQVTDVGGAGKPSRFYRIVLLPDAQSLIISTNAISVLEGGTNNFSVRLSIPPASNITVTVARFSGSTNIEPAAGTTLNFTPGNWNIPQSVPIRALPDTDTVNGEALFTIASTGLGTRSVAVTEIDGGSVPLRITSISRSGQNILINFPTTSGQLYRLERTISPTFSVWTTSVDNISGTGSVVQVSDMGGAAGTSAFYRIRLLP